MSESAPEVVELASLDGPGFAGLMDALAPEPGEPAGDAGGAEAPPAADGGGQPAAPAEGAPAAPSEPGAPAGGGGGQQGVPADAGAAGAAPAADAAPAAGAEGGAADPAGGAGEAGAGAPAAGSDAGGAVPADWTAASADVIKNLGTVSTSFEEATLQGFQEAAVKEVQEEHAKYFDALKQHPRQLVGLTVPKAGGEGTETLRDSEDAKEWQEAVKQLLVQEINARTQAAVDENSGFMDTVHASIDLFQSNPDLVPYTKEFDRELADRFSAMAADYEVRIDGKLHGYSIPVQNLIGQIRNQLVKERAAAAATPPAGASAAGGAATPPAGQAAAAAPEPPQAGIPSKSGVSDSEGEGFGTLFGTIHPSLRDMRI